MYPALTYSTDNTDPADGVEFIVTVAGVTDFNSADNITLRRDECLGPPLIGEAEALSGTGAGRSLTLVPKQAYGTVAVCLSRDGGVSYSQVRGPRVQARGLRRRTCQGCAGRAVWGRARAGQCTARRALHSHPSGQGDCGWKAKGLRGDRRVEVSKGAEPPSAQEVCQGSPPQSCVAASPCFRVGVPRRLSSLLHSP